MIFIGPNYLSPSVWFFLSATECCLYGCSLTNTVSRPLQIPIVSSFVCFLFRIMLSLFQLAQHHVLLLLHFLNRTRIMRTGFRSSEHWRFPSIKGFEKSHFFGVMEGCVVPELSQVNNFNQLLGF